ncbi:MAG: hypothetical protein WA510_13905 [Acidobacteriaceae bacterium]
MTPVESDSLVEAIRALRTWMESRQFTGHDPFDLLNSAYLRGARIPRSSLAGNLLSILIIQGGKRFGGLRLRRLLKVPASRNPKALGLCLSAYCDLARSGQDVAGHAAWLKSELIRLRSAHEPDYCWGYDWDYVSFRGSRLTAFSPNCVATYFCGSAFLDMSEVFQDGEAREIAQSAAHFVASRLNRSFESPEEICFSYTPNDITQIFNSSALAGALLARAGKLTGGEAYLSLARKSMVFLARRQLPAGGWYYGKLRRQQWIDSFHTSYNVCALLAYQQVTGDSSFEEPMLRGHRYYQSTFFTRDGVPRYFHDETFPVDIHASAQAILHFAAFSSIDPAALDRAWIIFRWVLTNMRAPDGYFYYQRHRFWTNRTPYMRWGQAWMLRALARLLLVTRNPGSHVGL